MSFRDGRRYLLDAGTRPNSSAEQSAVPIGFAAQLLGASRAHNKLPIDYLQKIIAPANLHGLLKIYFSARGDPVGMLVWARPATDVEERFMRMGQWQFHLSEWDEGGVTWLVDVVAPMGGVAGMLHELLTTSLAAETVFRYFHKRSDRLILKEIDRSCALKLVRRLAHRQR